LGTPPGVFWATGPSRYASRLQGASPNEKMMIQKSHVNTLYRSLKVKNTRNRKYLFYRVINQIKGIIRKSSLSNVKHDIIIIYVENMWEFNMIKDKVHVCIVHASTSPNLTYARLEHKGDKTNMKFGVYYI
jgi:hypothetical protein